ncbi:MAG: hypothetical protein ABIU87_09810 [Ornithinibacter sp.]
MLPVDARPAPAPVTCPDGAKLGNRREPFDAPFGQEKTNPVTFHRAGVPVTAPRSNAIPTFNDTNPNRYWTADNPLASNKVAGSGTQISVTNTSHHAEQLTLKVSFPK